jgi:Na+/melibiose symporter-like transporter
VAIFTGLGMYVTFRPLFLSTVISPAQVGSIMLIGSVVTTVSNPIIGALGDSMQAQKPLMLLSTTGQAITQLAMLVPGQGYTGMLLWNTLHSVIGAHLTPIFDASIMAVCPERYGDIRLLGSAAFGLAAFGGGALISVLGGTARSTFVAAFGVSSLFQLGAIPLLSSLDVSALHVQKAEKKAAGAAPEPGPPPSGVAAMLKVCSSAKMIYFMCIAILSGWQSSLIDTFFNVHLSAIGAPGLLMGTARLLTCEPGVSILESVHFD